MCVPVSSLMRYEYAVKRAALMHDLKAAEQGENKGESVCGSEEENGLLLTLRHTIELAAEYAEKEAPVALWLVVASMACAWTLVIGKQVV